MTPTFIFWSVVIIFIWTWFGGNCMENMPNETPKGMRAIGYALVLGPLLGTLLVGIIIWEAFCGKEKEKRRKEEKKQYEGDKLLEKIKYAMDNPTYQFEVDGEWLPRDEAIKRLITRYFSR